MRTCILFASVLFASVWMAVSVAFAAPPSDPDALANVESEVKWRVWSGWQSSKRIAEAIAWTWGWDESLDQAWLANRIAAEFARKREEEAHWPAQTDNDRLERAFDALRTEGVIALHDAGITLSDGMDDVAQARHEHPKADTLIGWCFYHGQDIQLAQSSGGLLLAFGSFDDARRTPAEVAARIRAALEREGFTVRWDGDEQRRLEIVPFVWRRRGGA